ncbi:nucleoside 2-deoxyribosyltransferase [Paludibacteraceae bacterium OttesenSCG-928-F17]|nr:nucleoside 2-deoxyribosyltransferase [Paludibacteraceae bacterium OttesenSCG-928-F17]
MKNNEICLVGDIFIDVSLKTKDSDLKMRLGGVVHAARALWALNMPYSVAYFAPAYLDKHISDYLKELGCNNVYKLGNVETSPYVMLVQEVKEIGDQGYEFLLRDNIEITYVSSSELNLKEFEEILVVSGSYSLSVINEYFSNEAKIHIDVANNILSLSEIDILNNKIETVFISTSSDIFKKYYEDNKDDFSIINFFQQFNVETVVLKENRGGSRAFIRKELTCIHISSQTQPIAHSVGVGDAYNAVYVSSYRIHPVEDALNLASWIAAEYAKTTYVNDFKKMVQRIVKIPIDSLKNMGGCLLPWEKRKEYHIYIAAPDFDFIDTKLIDLLENNFLYHNFVPHRPIKENGQMEQNANLARKQELFVKDMQLIDKCTMLIAVLLYNDPGTLIEIGIAVERGIPVVVFDPNKTATNCMLTQAPDLLTSDIDELITFVFNQYGRSIKR